MDYFAIYDSLMSTANARNVGLQYCEMHHVKPRCCGGSDDVQNLAKLTFREHYLAHKLLVKMHPDDTLLANALWMMTVMTNASLHKLKSCNAVDSRIHNRLKSIADDDKMHMTSYDYAFSKAQHIKHMTGHHVSDAARKRISDSTKSAMQSKDIIQRCASGSRGSRHYYNKKTFEQHKWFPGQPEIDLQIYSYGRPPMSQQQKDKISALKSLHKTKYHNDKLQITLDVYHDCICKVPDGWILGKVEYRNNAAFKKFVHQVKSMLLSYDIFFDSIFTYVPSCVSKKKKMLNPAFFDVCHEVLQDWKSTGDNVLNDVVMFIRDNMQLAKTKANEYLKEGFKK